MTLPRWITLQKKVGETPLHCVETWRSHQAAAYQTVPLAYAGRLDPMASGTLLVLIGDECKTQESYHSLDKKYDFSVLFGVASDTHDVLGRLTIAPTTPIIKHADIVTAAQKFTGTITLSYPHFSSKTVQGKPLHTWTLEGRLNEITIPANTSTVYQLTLTHTETINRQNIYNQVSEKIETIPPVTDDRKALGNDFRRTDVRADWKLFSEFGRPDDTFTIAHFTCVASSGTYMRSLAHAIGNELGTFGLAYHIHRSTIGNYLPLPIIGGMWTKRY